MGVILHNDRKKCAECLARVGFGVKRIIKLTGLSKTTLRRHLKMKGLISDELGRKKRKAFNTSIQRSIEEDEFRKHYDLIINQYRSDIQVSRLYDMMWIKHPIVIDHYNDKKAQKSRDYSRNYYNKNHRQIYQRIKTNPVRLIKQRLRTRIWKVLKQNTKSMKTMELTGCSGSYLREHIERQFNGHMSWDNYGKWHIDHIIPCSAFDLSKEEEQKVCFNWQNLRPMWAKANRKKHAFITINQQHLPINM